MLECFECVTYACVGMCCVRQTLITQTRAKQAATMSEVEWRGRIVPVKIDKARIFLLGLSDNEAAIAQVSLQLLLSGAVKWCFHPFYIISCYSHWCE